jgi:hypothetical protein
MNKNVSEKTLLTNIVDCNVTIITTDGYAAYQQWSINNSSVANKLSSSVSENINRYKDDVAEGQLVNPAYEKNPPEEIQEDYEPRGVPHPFRSAKRGIGEEISKSLLNHLRPNALKLTGICYNLEAYHPDFLFVAAIDRTKQQVMEAFHRNQGVGFREVGRLQFLEPSFEREETLSRLAQPGWVAGDEASLFRAIELVDELKKRHSNFAEVFKELATR